MELHNLFTISDIVNIINDYEPTGNNYIHKSNILLVINNIEFIERTDFFYTSINGNTFRLSRVFTISGVKRLLRAFFNDGIWNYTIYTYQGKIVLTDNQISDLNCFLVHK